MGIAIVGLLILTLVCWAWANGIDKMNREHPDYKGKDLFGEDED